MVSPSHVPPPVQSMRQTFSGVQPPVHSAGQLELPGGVGSGPHGGLPPTPALGLPPELVAFDVEPPVDTGGLVAPRFGVPAPLPGPAGPCAAVASVAVVLSSLHPYQAPSIPAAPTIQ